jgi:hypothetical protein
MNEDLIRIKRLFPSIRWNHCLLINKFRTSEGMGVLSAADLIAVLPPNATRRILERNLRVVRQRFKKAGIELQNVYRIGWSIKAEDRQLITEWMQAERRAPKRPIQLEGETQIRLMVRQAAWEYFKSGARKRKVSLNELMNKLFQCIADDKMIEAILDDAAEVAKANDVANVVQLPRAS